MNLKIESALTEDQQVKYERGNSRFFDNPLTHKILTKEDVATILHKSTTWVARMTACGVIPHHYVGDTAMYYLDEVVSAFLSDSLARKRAIYEKHPKHQKQGWEPEVRSNSHGSREETIQTLRRAARSRGLD